MKYVCNVDGIASKCNFSLCKDCTKGVKNPKCTLHAQPTELRKYFHRQRLAEVRVGVGGWQKSDRSCFLFVIDKVERVGGVLFLLFNKDKVGEETDFGRIAAGRPPKAGGTSWPKASECETRAEPESSGGGGVADTAVADSDSDSI